MAVICDKSTQEDKRAGCRERQGESHPCHKAGGKNGKRTQRNHTHRCGTQPHHAPAKQQANNSSIRQMKASKSNLTWPSSAFSNMNPDDRASGMGKEIEGTRRRRSVEAKGRRNVILGPLEIHSFTVQNFVFNI